MLFLLQFGNLFGRKKQQPTAKTEQTTQQKTESKSEDSTDQKTQETAGQKGAQDQVDGPTQVNATKKSGKSGVCSIL